jgi:protein-disulfide isomerase
MLRKEGEGKNEKIISSPSRLQAFLVPIAIIIAGAMISGAVVYSNKYKANLAGSVGKALPTQEEEQQQAPAEDPNKVYEVSTDDDPFIGPKDAKVTLIEFSDFECSFCGKNVPTIKELAKTYGDKIKIVFRDFPLDFHPNAKTAAMAAGCANDQGKFWQYHDKLFENQKKLDLESLKSYAKELGLNASEFSKCLDSKKHESEVTKDAQDGQKASVTGTPTSFINGRKVEGAQPIDQFKKIIDEELKK